MSNLDNVVAVPDSPCYAVFCGLTRLNDRLRDALLRIHPALERLLGPRLDRGWVQDLLAIAPTPAQMAGLGSKGILPWHRRRRTCASTA